MIKYKEATRRTFLTTDEKKNQHFGKVGRLTPFMNLESISKPMPSMWSSTSNWNVEIPKAQSVSVVFFLREQRLSYPNGWTHSNLLHCNERFGASPTASKKGANWFLSESLKNKVKRAWNKKETRPERQSTTMEQVAAACSKLPLHSDQRVRTVETSGAIQKLLVTSKGQLQHKIKRNS